MPSTRYTACPTLWFRAFNLPICCRSDQKLCRRNKRQRCRASLSAAHPLYAAERVAEMCRARKWLNRCVRRAVRQWGKAAGAGGAGGADEAAGGRERLKAAEKGRCRARLEKRVRAERRKRRKAAGEGADKSGEREAGFLNNLFLQWSTTYFYRLQTFVDINI